MKALLSPLALMLSLLAGVAHAQLYTGPFGPDGTWNVYQVLPAATYADAKAAAEAMPCPGNPAITGGHLVTFSSRGENLFIRSFCDQKSVWIGLALPTSSGAGTPGWSWISGDAPAYENWGPGQPYLLPGRMACAALNQYGAWLSIPGSRRMPPSDKLPYVVEWETRAAAPVTGATAYTKVWRDAMALPKPVSGLWSLRWISGYIATTVTSGRSTSTSFALPKSIGEADILFDPSITKGRQGPPVAIASQVQSSVSVEPQLIAYTQDASRQGWLVPMDSTDSSFTGFPETSAFIGAAVGKIHVAKAGTYTLAISAEDCFALRLGGFKWKSVSGDAFIDPLDPLTVTQPYGNFCAKALATIDLPAGDHLVEALWMTETTGSEFHVLSAPGEFRTEGATTDWRALGHPAASGVKVPRLGVSAAGWSIECSTPLPSSEDGKAPKLGMQEALVRMELEKEKLTPHTAPQLNFSGVPGSSPSHYPDTRAFPNASESGAAPQGPWALRAKAKLVVPAAGQYEIGVHASGMAALRIPMAQLIGFSQMAQGSAGLHMMPNSFDFDGRLLTQSEPKLVSSWSFSEASEYEVELFYLVPGGVSPSLSVFASPHGPYPPALISAGAAGISPDVPGLPLVTF